MRDVVAKIVTIFCIKRLSGGSHQVSGYEINADVVSSHFKTVADSKYFVDKTELIKDFLTSGQPLQLARAPPGFGKSVALDAIGLFAGIRVDERGVRVAPDETDARRLFEKLAVCKDRAFVDEHLGRHPVLRIEYGRLEETTNYRSFLDGFRLVVLEAFEPHSYLLGNKSLFPSSKSRKQFRKMYKLFSTPSETVLQTAFRWLSQLLFEHFGKKVLVLLDDYDAHFNHNQPQSENNETEAISAFMTNVSEALFRGNAFLGRALATSVHRVAAAGSEEALQDHRFLGDHAWSRHFGFTEEDVVSVLARNVKKPTGLLSGKRIVIEHYGWYEVDRQKLKLYCPYTVRMFITHHMGEFNFWARERYLDCVAAGAHIARTVEHLLNGGCVGVASIDDPLAARDLLRLNALNEYLRTDNLVPIQLVMRYFFDLGFLRPVRAAGQDPSRVLLELANREVKTEFAMVLARRRMERCGFRAGNIEAYQDAVGRLNPGKNFTDAVRLFHGAVRDLFRNASYVPRSEFDLRSVLAVFAAGKFVVGSAEPPGAPPADCEEGRREAICAANRRGTLVVIKPSYRPKIKEKETEAGGRTPDAVELAETGHRSVADKYRDGRPETLGDKRLEGAVYVGLAFDECTRNISVVCSSSASPKTTAIEG